MILKFLRKCLILFQLIRSITWLFWSKTRIRNHQCIMLLRKTLLNLLKLCWMLWTKLLLAFKFQSQCKNFSQNYLIWKLKLLKDFSAFAFSKLLKWKVSQTWSWVQIKTFSFKMILAFLEQISLKNIPLSVKNSNLLRLIKNERTNISSKLNRRKRFKLTENLKKIKIRLCKSSHRFRKKLKIQN